MATALPSSHTEWLNLFSHISSILHVPPTRTAELPDLDAHATARLIDHTLLAPAATSQQISALCAEARQHHFRTVCVRTNYVAQAKKELSGSDVGIASVIGFPSDDTPPSFTTKKKIEEAEKAVSEGATELDMVLDYEALKEATQTSDKEQPNTYTAICEDVLAVRKAVPEIVLLKVIFETSQLMIEDVARASIICCLAGADFVKTSTGFRGHGATSEVVQLMRTVCDVCQKEGLTNKKVQVKASGGIRTAEDVRKMVSVGAERIGASAGVAIISSLDTKDAIGVKEVTDASVEYLSGQSIQSGGAY
jgi:deoxyribose-phosphate aldolase